MKYKSAYSSAADTFKAIAEISSSLKDTRPEVVLFFSSSIHEPSLVSKLFQEWFPGATTFGCSTAGELCQDEVLKGSIVAMAFSHETFKSFQIGLVDLSDAKKGVEQVFSSFESHLGQSMYNLDHERYFGLALIDGLSCKEESVNERIGDLTNILFVGGSAGDDLKFEKTHVFLDGQAFVNKALLAVFEPHGKFGFIKTQSFVPSGKVLKATMVDEAKREVMMFDDKPAVKAYAEALEVEESDLANHLFMNPLGMMSFSGEPFVRSPQQIIGDKMAFYCQIQQGMDYSVLRSTDIIADTQAALDYKEKEMGGISAIINFNCILRTLELENKQLVSEYGKLFDNYQSIGFSTYGESYIGHINQTATMIVLQ